MGHVENLPQVNSGSIVLPENLERFYGKPGCFGQLNKVKSGILPNPQHLGVGAFKIRT
jgi:hypothetical protein